MCRGIVRVEQLIVNWRERRSGSLIGPASRPLAGRRLGRRRSRSADRVPLHFAQASLEESALGIIRGERERPRIALRRLRVGAEAPQQIGSRGVEQMILVELVAGGELVDESQRRPRARSLGNCFRSSTKTATACSRLTRFRKTTASFSSGWSGLLTRIATGN